jgi:hypothetical protein
MRVIAHNDLGGGDRGKGGEGFSELRAKDGRRILCMANESGPTCFSVIDVTDPRNPAVLKTIDVPGPNTRCNNLDASGNLPSSPTRPRRPARRRPACRSSTSATASTPSRSAPSTPTASSRVARTSCGWRTAATCTCRPA